MYAMSEARHSLAPWVQLSTPKIGGAALKQ